MRRWTIAGALVPTLGLLAACATPQHSSIPLPYAFATATDGSGTPVDPAAMARWWHSFDDPLLHHFMQMGLSRNLEIQMAMADIRAARAQLRQATAGLLPIFDTPLEAARTWQENPLEGSRIGEAVGLGGSTLRIDTWQAAVEGQWLPDIFGAGRARRQAAGRQVGVAQAEAVAVRIAVAANIAQTYLQIRGLLAQRQALEELIAVARESERATRGFFELGAVTQLDVAAASAERASAEAQRGEIDAGLVEATFALDTLLDAPPGMARGRMGSSGTIPVTATRIPTGQPFELLQRRPDVIAATAGLDAAELQALAARRDLFPQLGLSASATRMGFSLADISSTSDMANIAAQLTFPWLSPANWAEVPLADAEVARGFVGLRQAIATAVEEVEVASGQMEARRRQQGAAGNAVTLQRERLALARRAYETGFSNITEVLEAQQGLLQARQSVIEARLALANAQVGLFTALGGGWNATATAPQDTIPAPAGLQAGVQAVSAELAENPIPDRTRSSTAPAPRGFFGFRSSRGAQPGAGAR